MGNHIIMKGDSSIRIHELDDNSISLTITSPPYFNAKKYNGEQNNIGNNKSYNEYLDKIKNILEILFKKTIEGGFVVWNTSPVLDNGKRIGIPFDTHRLFIELGYEFLEDVIWVKPDGAAKLRCGGWCQNNGRPTTWHANINTEYLMIYKKPGTRKPGDFDPLKTYYPIIPKDLLTSTWKINTDSHTTWHDAPFSTELVKRCILLFSFKEDTVFDPFLGSGTVMQVARDLGRNSIGIELSPDYIAKAKEKLGFYQKGLFNSEEYEEL